MYILIEECEGALWCAAIDNNTLQAIEIDTPEERVRWGDIFQARVKTIDKARDAAFVDLGDDLTGILYNQNLRIEQADGSVLKGGSKPIGQMISAGDTLIVQAKSSFIENDDDLYRMENKIAEVSMDISLQGRHLIYCPLMQDKRISQRITNKDLRAQIKQMLHDLTDMKGCIVRASAAHTQTDILRREAEILTRGWQSILDNASALNDSNAPDLLASGLDAMQRTLSDYSHHALKSIEVVTMEHLEYAEQWCKTFAPDLSPKITPVELDDATDDLALFHERDIMDKITELTLPYVKLPHGGNIIIQDTAALTAIDVNKGNDNRAHLDTNIEAAIAALRHIRLRNIGGTILIDSLKCKKKAEQDILLKTVREEAAKDPCTVQIHGMTGTGMIELSRKRRTAPLSARLPKDFAG